MIPITGNLVFSPENINTSSESSVSIILKHQEFITSKNSDFLIFEDEDLQWLSLIHI